MLAPVLSLICLVLLLPGLQAATYYVSSAGHDDADGRSPQTAWRSLDRVDRADLRPGDKMLFRRGDTWRGSLHAHSGSEEGVITYATYGEGPLPALLGSVSRSAPGDWRDEGGGVWSTGRTEEPALPAPPPGTGLDLGLYCEGGAEATLTRTPGGYQVACAQPGSASHHIQVIATGLSIKEGRAYRFACRARASKPFVLAAPPLMASAPPWTQYSTEPAMRTRTVGDQWVTIVQYYRSVATTSEGRLTLYLGGALPAGGVLDLEQLSFAECPAAEIPPEPVLPVDVGNLILGNEASCGVKRWTRQDLKAQGDFWYDQEGRALYLFSADNPAVHYGHIECALARHIIDEGGAHYVTYENLALKYGAAHGIGGGNTHHITVRGCEISYIGGADQYGKGGSGPRVRFGNGIEFWGAAHDNLVERCRLWEIYDAALTNQNGGAVVEEANLTYRYNIIWNAEYSFEYWNRPEESVTRNVRFENNTCLNAGHGWGHAQRPDPSGRHLCFYDSPARASDIYIRNNIFYEAASHAFYAPGWSKEALDALQVDHNLWFQAAGTMIAFKTRGYTMQQFPEYQRDWDREHHSLCGDPRWVDPAKDGFGLRPDSPCVDAGVDTGATFDFLGQPVPKGHAPDIGAVESH
jgi:hypothetical protein